MVVVRLTSRSTGCEPAKRVRASYLGRDSRGTRCKLADIVARRLHSDTSTAGSDRCTSLEVVDRAATELSLAPAELWKISRVLLVPFVSSGAHETMTAKSRLYSSRTSETRSYRPLAFWLLLQRSSRSTYTKTVASGSLQIYGPASSQAP